MTQPKVRLTGSSHIPGMSDDNETYPYTLASIILSPLSCTLLNPGTISRVNRSNPFGLRL